MVGSIFFAAYGAAAPAPSTASTAPSLQPSAPAGNTNASSAAVANPRLVTAYSSIAPTVGALWVTKDSGLFEKHGLDVDQQYIASTTSVNAVMAGQAQLAAVGGSEALGAIAGGADLVIITTDTPVYPYIFEVAPGINSPNDLKGKPIGISRFGSSSDIATRVT
jgi:NitT/TauT family transport system substrate-binding protein